MRKIAFVLLAGLSSVLYAGNVPTKITYQGTLKKSGVPANGTFKMRFDLVSSDDRTQYWTSADMDVRVSSGLFSANLEPTGVDWQNVNPFIRVSVEGQALGPIEPVTSTIYSVMSGSVIDGAIEPSKLAPSVQQSLVPVGTILAFGGNTAPDGFLFCDGSPVSRSTYHNLFSAIGNVWGSGDGSSTFNLPDLRGRAPIGAGTGNGLTIRTIGESFGEETHQLTIAEMPSHNHDIDDQGHVHTGVLHTGGSAFSGGITPILSDTVQSTDRAFTGIKVLKQGGSQPHNNMQPSAVVNYIIKY